LHSIQLAQHTACTAYSLHSIWWSCDTIQNRICIIPLTWLCLLTLNKMMTLRLEGTYFIDIYLGCSQTTAIHDVKGNFLRMLLQIFTYTYILFAWCCIHQKSKMAVIWPFRVHQLQNWMCSSNYSSPWSSKVKWLEYISYNAVHRRSNEQMDNHWRQHNFLAIVVTSSFSW